MRFLADENIPAEAVRRLTEAGHDVVWVRTILPGRTDAEIIARAVSDGRIVLTFDKDFGEIAQRTGLPPVCGVVLFRLPMGPSAQIGAMIAGRITERGDWAGHFSVIEPGRVRMRPLAGRPEGRE